MRKHSTVIYLVVIFVSMLVQSCSSRETDSNVQSVTNAEVSQTQKEMLLPLVGQWRPEEACDFLKGTPAGLPTRGYKDLFGDGEYTCSSDYQELEEGPLPNNLAYYGYGNASAVKKLKLVLNVKSRGQRALSHGTFQRASAVLTQKATGDTLPAAAIRSLNDGKPGRWMVGGYLVEVTREEWPTGKGHEVHFTIPPPRQ